MHLSEPIQKIYEKYRNRIKFVYNCYIDMVHSDIKDFGFEDMKFNSFMLFTDHYNIYPGILISEQIQLIFKSSIKIKKNIDNNPIGKNFKKIIKKRIIFI